MQLLIYYLRLYVWIIQNDLDWILLLDLWITDYKKNYMDLLFFFFNNIFIDSNLGF